ncbi:hypothetical protein LTR84_009275 [Exophiala bonariae]|uniref:Cupin 2 conserved barrel domain-containing protein n=1 Tax=Exophiala bonariae TaxID=1690606 RepID=A0AAV9MVC9_9EURO|nr:hypothetical protein LTR84_009275 [Exophiala bonariae]
MSSALPESIAFELFGDRVIFTFASRHSTLITIPPGSAWEPGAHWHESYVENVRVVKGRAWVSVNGVVKEIGPGEGSVRFELRDVHTFGRADRGRKSEDSDHEEEDVVLEEWTEPDDGFKQVFFYNLLRIAQTATANSSLFRPSTILQLVRVIAHVDNYADLLPFLTAYWWLPFSLKYALVHAVYGFGSALGWAFGYQKWLKEYTPRDLWSVAERGAVTKRGREEGGGGRKDL